MKTETYTVNGKEYTMKEYRSFMCNKANEYNCSECPENKGYDNSQYPCGQQNCWVTCHCKRM